MKNFEFIHEGYNPSMSREDYLKHKREVVLTTIEPICKVFGINDYDYVVTNGKEYLQVEGTKIGCSMNSIYATVRQLINYIWMKIEYPNTYLEGSEEEIYKRLTKYWMED